MLVLLLPTAARAVQPTFIDSTQSASLQPMSLEELSLEDLMNVKVTTVTRQESTVGQSAVAVFVITPEMIHRSGATSIPELLRMVPGVDVARVNSNEWAISIRGLNNSLGNNLSNKLLVQMDGRTLYNPIFSGVYWETVDYPLEDIDRIEVIRGPGGSVWGANAVNGIINIITKSARDTQGGFAELGAGTFERAFATTRYGASTGDSSYRVYGKAFERGAYPGIGGDQHDDWRSARAGFRFDRAPAGKTAFTVQGDIYAGRHLFGG